MCPVLSFIIFIFLNFVQCQDPRKRFIIDSSEYQKDGDIDCSMKNCLKRSSSLDDMGPFWANRGKKDPTYSQGRYFVDEPHWVLVRKDADTEPFFTSRGKKQLFRKTLKYMYDDVFKARRDRRDFTAEDTNPAFFASRGKKWTEKY